jgi:hypothetical protein
MAPNTRNRKNAPAAASKSPNQPNPQSTRASANKRAPPAPRPTTLAKRVRNNTTTDGNEPSTNNPSTGAEDFEETIGSTDQSESIPTLENYKSLMKSWPPGRIREYLQEHKKSNRNRPPTEVSDRVKLVFKQFKQELLMLAMIGQVSESTIKSFM